MDLFRCTQCSLAALLSAASLLLLGVVVPRHILVGHDGTYYLDSIGLGAAVWGLLCPAYAVSTLGARKETPPSSYVLYDEEHMDVEEAFTAWPLFTFPPRLYDFSVQLGKSAINAAGVVMVFSQLPARNPHEPLNAAKHIVSWIELPIVLLYVVQALLTTLHGDVVKATAAASGMRDFSVLRLLPALNPGRFKAVCQTRGLLATIALALSAPVMLFGAGLALMIKVAQVDFVTTTEFLHWTVGNWLAFFMFAVNIGGIMPTASAKIGELFGYVHPHEPEAEAQWRQRLVSVLRARYGGFTALVVYATVSAKDVAKLLRLEVRGGMV